MNDITKLPKWAQERITDFERQRDAAITALNEYQDSQTESPFLYWDYVSTGEGSGNNRKTRFIQTNKISVHWASVELTVLIRPDQNEIDLQWRHIGNIMGEIAFIPTSFCQAKLKSKSNLL